MTRTNATTQGLLLSAIDRLTSQVGASSTLVLTDDSVDQTLTFSLGGIVNFIGGSQYVFDTPLYYQSNYVVYTAAGVPTYIPKFNGGNGEIQESLLYDTGQAIQLFGNQLGVPYRFEIGYSGSIYTQIQTNSSGITTFTPTGGSAEFRFDGKTTIQFDGSGGHFVMRQNSIAYGISALINTTGGVIWDVTTDTLSTAKGFTIRPTAAWSAGATIFEIDTSGGAKRLSVDASTFQLIGTVAPQFPSINLTDSSNQIVVQSGGVTGTFTWTPTSSNKTITFPDSTGNVPLLETTNTFTGANTFSAESIHNGGIDIGTSGRFDSNVVDGSGKYNFLFQPTTTLSSGASNAIVAIKDVSGNITYTSKPDGTHEFGGVATSGGYITVGVAGRTESYGILFQPTFAGGGASIFGVGSSVTGGFFRAQGTTGRTWTTGVGGGFVANHGITGTYTEMWAGKFQALQAGIATTPTTDVGGLKIYGIVALHNQGTNTNWYGGWIMNSCATALASGQAITNTYGLYMEQQTRGGTINNGILMLEAGTNSTYKSIAFRDQNAWINSANASELSLQAATNIISYIGGTAKHTVDTTNATFAINAIPSTNGGFDIGGNGAGWNALWLKDSSAAFELKVITTNTSISADRTLTINLGDANRTLNLIPSSAYTPTNVTTDRSYDANSTSIDELADVVGTIIADLQAKGILG